ncbi:helix-turn-helix domain-containing protein [Cellulosimicrobium sp. RS]|uniref:helix-turn-helix domain-containing protein n=1 Tax=Cellulosimicrobium sp. RS TaxID=3381347 RepID=UPI0038FD3210
MTDDVAPLPRFEWERVVRRARALPLATKGVAYTLATYASDDGRRIFPGEQRLALVCGVSPRMIRKHIATLRAAGLLELVSRADRRHGRADEHRLTVPTDDEKLAALDLLDPDEFTGTQVPVTSHDQRNSGSPDDVPAAPDHRNLSAPSPEPECTITGTQVPPTRSLPTTTRSNIGPVTLSRPDRAREKRDGEQGWSDVPLFDDVPVDELYPAAIAYLEQTVGTELAGGLVAEYHTKNPDVPMQRAVVDVAASQGWAA